MDIAKLELEIRERSFPERVDLALLIIRNYFPSILFWGLVGYAPFFALNFVFIWLMTDDYWQYGFWIGPWILTLQWNFVILPFAMIPLSIFLSRRIFGQQPGFVEVFKLAWKRIGAMIWVHVFCRINFILFPLVLLIYISEEGAPIVLLFLVHLFVWNIARCSRPFIDLILYLEQLPIRAKSKKDISAGQRSKRISDQSSGGTFIGMFGMAVVMEFLIAINIYCVLLYTYFFFTEDTVTQIWFGWTFVPICVWAANLVTTVYVFVSYLDSRIRNEGWEIELRMKMEAEKLLPSKSVWMESGPRHSIDHRQGSLEVQK